MVMYMHIFSWFLFDTSGDELILARCDVYMFQMFEDDFAMIDTSCFNLWYFVHVCDVWLCKVRECDYQYVR